MNVCACGCGHPVKRTYAQGHNTKRGIGGDLRARLLAKVAKAESGCWEWTGNLNRKGYGEIRLKNGKSGGKRASAHRVSYEIFNGPIPTDSDICHVCDNPKCINPAHLIAETRQYNLKDMVQKGRSLRGSKNSKAKLGEEQAREIKSSSAPLKDLAGRFGVSESAISKIRTGKNWHWL